MSLRAVHAAPRLAPRRRSVGDGQPRVASARRVSRARPLRAPSAAASDEDANTSPGIAKLADTPSVSLMGDGVKSEAIPSTPGVYAVYDDDDEIQYIGLSRKVSASVKLHAFELPLKCASARCASIPDAAKADLQLAWKAWMVEHIATSGGVLPPGNVQGCTLWSDRKRRDDAKANVALTDGRGGEVDDESLAALCRDLVDKYPIVAFIKGTRKEPECGFSHRMVAMLDEIGVDYETVDTLDETRNHNLRNVLKTFSEWPTIPQLYHDGELVGGHDILQEMHKSGDLKALLTE